jgi:putative transposase
MGHLEADGAYLYLFMTLSVFSRYVSGRMLGQRESAELARLIELTCEKEQIQAGQLTLHADRGSSMIFQARRLSDGGPWRH